MMLRLANILQKILVMVDRRNGQCGGVEGVNTNVISGKNLMKLN